MPAVRILTAVAGTDFSWISGEVVEMDEEQAKAWADGLRAELVEPADERRGTDTATEPTEKAATRSRGGGRGRRAETRSE